MLLEESRNRMQTSDDVVIRKTVSERCLAEGSVAARTGEMDFEAVDTFLHVSGP